MECELWYLQYKSQTSVHNHHFVCLIRCTLDYFQIPITNEFYHGIEWHLLCIVTFCTTQWHVNHHQPIAASLTSNLVIKCKFVCFMHQFWLLCVMVNYLTHFVYFNVTIFLWLLIRQTKVKLSWRMEDDVLEPGPKELLDADIPHVCGSLINYISHTS